MMNLIRMTHAVQGARTERAGALSAGAGFRAGAAARAAGGGLKEAGARYGVFPEGTPQRSMGLLHDTCHAGQTNTWAP